MEGQEGLEELQVIDETPAFAPNATNIDPVVLKLGIGSKQFLDTLPVRRIKPLIKKHFPVIKPHVEFCHQYSMVGYCCRM
jgi:hypothetical protein